MKKFNLPSVNLYLESNQNVKNPKRSVFFRVRFGKATFRIQTGQKIEERFWDYQNKRIKKSHSNSLEINSLLRYQEEIIWKVWSKLQQSKIISADLFRESCTKELHGDVISSKEDLWKHYESFIKSLEETRKRPRTIQKYNTLKNLLNDFEKEKRVALRFSSFDVEFHQSFTGFLFRRGQTNNTVGKYISSLKTFLGWSFARGLHDNAAFKDYEVMDEDSDIFYFTQDEMIKLYQTDLSYDKELEHARDFICFECFTGQRYSDVTSINWTDIDFTSRTWSLWVVKTRKHNKIPLSDSAIQILRKYRTKPKPFELENHQVNRRIKNICKLLGFDEDVKRVRYQGSQPIEKIFTKYTRIASHIGRRTFIIHSLENGISAEVVKSITGHRTDRAFQKYVKIADQTKRKAIEQVWNAPIFILPSKASA